MLRSVFLRRIVFMMLLTLGLSVALISFFFVVASSQTLESSRQNEMVSRAQALADNYTDEVRESDGSSWISLVSDKSFVNSYVMVFDDQGALITQTSENSDESAVVLSHLKSYLDSNLLMKTNSTFDVSVISGSSISQKIMVVQVPIKSDDGLITGYIAMANPLTEVAGVQQSLFKVLLLVISLVSLFMLIPIYMATSRLVKPLQEINKVARAFARGDFSVRANTGTKSEIGELAVSFNDLADKLSSSISELTIERNRLREIFDVMSEAVVSVNLNLEPVYSNPVVFTLFEKSKRKNFFTEHLQLVPFEEVWEDFQKCIDEGVTVERTIDGRDCAYLSTIVPTFDSSRKVTGATGFFRDISESERLEQTRRDYVANVSHELRTPLTALRGLVEPLADGMVRNEDDRQRYYNIILHETMRLSRLIDDMLELSRLQAKTIAFKTFPFDLNELLKEIEAKFTPIMSDSDLVFKIMNKSGPCPTVMGNPDRVEQIIVILLDNAKKYTPPGHSITISTEWNGQTDQVLVSVIDTGQGIHEYDIDHIFDRFYKADRARGKKGTGLGLSIAKELLNYMGETISVQSEYGEGTTFTFTLKCVRGTMWY